MNEELLAQVQEKVRTVPESFSMKSWGYRADAKPGQGRRPPCGYVACIGGWICLLGNPDQVNFGNISGSLYVKDPGSELSSVSEMAARLLNVPEGVLEHLFFEERWPRDLKRRFYAAKDRDEEAQIAADAIERFKQDFSRGDMSKWGWHSETFGDEPDTD